MKRPMKTEMNDYGGGSQKRSRGFGYEEALAEGKYELRILIPSKSAGAVIGKGGAFIKDIRQKFDANVSVPDKTTPERVLSIVCGQDRITECFRELYSKLSEDKDFKDQRDGEVRMLVHQSHAGAIIGRAGSKIKELREMTGSNLKVFQEVCPGSTDRILLITVEQSRMADTVDKIIEFLKEIPLKGPQRSYDASAYDPNVNYGGFVDKGFNYAGGSSRNSGGGGPPASMPRYDSYRGGPPAYSPPMGGGGPGGYGGNRPIHGGGGAPPPLSGYVPSHQETITTTQVTIPNELGGTIIGKGGERINNVRNESGAKIEVGTSNYGNDERVITISGTPHQIQMAQYLLQQSVRTSEAGRRYLREQR